MFEYKPIRIAGLDPSKREKVYGSSRISLCQKPEGQPGREYLSVTRGLDVETIAKFQLGFVPYTVNNPFAGRIMMPIFDAYWNLLALSFRTLTADKAALRAAGGKYWNETFPKGEHLYGFNLAKYSIVKMGYAILCEGQMDVIAMHAHGFTNAVGVLGGAFTPFQAFLLKKFTEQVVIMMDGDAAGAKHRAKCEEVLRLFAPQSVRGKVGNVLTSAFVNLPAGDDEKDPDSFLRKHGSEEMTKRIETDCQISPVVLRKMAA